MTKLNIFPFKAKSEKKESKKLSEFIYEFISKSKRLSKNYKRSYRNIARHVENFTKFTGLNIFTDSFTEPVAEEFIAYLKNKELMLSTVNDIFQRVVIMINRAAKAGYPVNRGFENIRIKGEESCAIYLTLDELDRLNSLTGLSKEAGAVRDRFLIGCFTALRISDYRRLSFEENFLGDYIQIKTQKTGVEVVIPIHPIIRDVLKRNNNILPKMPSSQAFGATIKRVCEKAGIKESVLFERTVGNKVIRKKVKKYQLVSSHTARRSGATNMYLAGIPTFRIMLFTGHKTEQAFFKYIRIDKQENAKTLQEHVFFKKKQ
jgi:integrase